VKYEYGLWPIVVFHVVWLLGFALTFLGPARRQEWRSLGIFSAFVVALYGEIFGFPLTIYVLTVLVGRLAVPEPFAHASGNLWATLVLGQWMASPLMLVGGLVILAGTVVLGVAWKRVYRAQGALVTAGPYAVVRHPQYSALFLVILGALVQWPTILTVFMAPSSSWHTSGSPGAKSGSSRRGSATCTARIDVACPASFPPRGLSGMSPSPTRRPRESDAVMPERSLLR